MKKPPIMENFEFIKKIVKLAKDEHASDMGKVPAALYDCLSDDAREVIRETAKAVEKSPSTVDESTTEVFKGVKLQSHQSNGEVIRHFCSLNPNWPVSRQILGFLMVHSPEYPTYFIPAFTQAKAKGDAGDLKKGEGARGIITGCLEGIAVGAIVSGKSFKLREMGPYMACGAALQYFSCKVFPMLGEKCGKAIYNKNLAKNAKNKPSLNVVSQSTMPSPAVKPLAQSSNAAQIPLTAMNKYSSSQIPVKVL